MSNEIILQNLKRAVKKLEEVLALEKTEITRDSAIKRFEICFDLSWKSIKNYAKEQGVECYSPRECFKVAFQLKLISEEDGWLKLIEDRNLSFHLYSEEKSDQIYSSLNHHLNLFNKLLSSL